MRSVILMNCFFLVASPGYLVAESLLSLTTVQEGRSFNFSIDLIEGINFSDQKPRTYVSKAKFSTCNLDIQNLKEGDYKYKLAIGIKEYRNYLFFNDYIIKPTTKTVGCEIVFEMGAKLEPF